MDLDDRYPALSDLTARARARVPHYVWEYLDSATGNQASALGSVAALDRVVLTPRALRAVTPDLATPFLGTSYDRPFGIAPVGMSGLIWPGAERVMARAARAHNVPFGLSTVAAATPEEVGPEAGPVGWFQLYAPGDAQIRRDMLARARDSGFTTLILTADVPVPSRRERQRRARLTNPMRLTPRILAQTALHPAWALATARAGIPRLRTLERYADAAKARGATDHIGYLLRTAPDWDYLDTLRVEWDGALVVKGILSPEDAARAAGSADAIWVSNHGGRQFEAAPAPADVLPAIRAAVGPDVPLVADGGIRSGTDILRLIARGADLVMLGRAFHHGLAALGPAGVDHVFHILEAGLRADLGQLGIARPADLRGGEIAVGTAPPAPA